MEQSRDALKEQKVDESMGATWFPSPQFDPLQTFPRWDGPDVFIRRLFTFSLNHYNPDIVIVFWESDISSFFLSVSKFHYFEELFPTTVLIISHTWRKRSPFASLHRYTLQHNFLLFVLFTWTHHLFSNAMSFPLSDICHHCWETSLTTERRASCPRCWTSFPTVPKSWPRLEWPPSASSSG